MGQETLGPMGKRLTKKALLAELMDEWDRLMESLDEASDRQLTRRGRNDADWSIKDVLTHLFDWENRGVDWWEAGRRSEEVELPAPGFNWGEIRALNDAILRRHRRKSLSTVRAELLAAHQRSLKAIAKTDDEELTTIGYATWTGKSWTLSDYFRANTASHYRWARKKIRRWLKADQMAKR